MYSIISMECDYSIISMECDISIFSMEFDMFRYELQLGAASTSPTVTDKNFVDVKLLYCICFTKL